MKIIYLYETLFQQERQVGDSIWACPRGRHRSRCAPVPRTLASWRCVYLCTLIDSF